MFSDNSRLTDAVLDGRKTMTRRFIDGEYVKVEAYRVQGGWCFIGETKDGDTVELKPNYRLGEIVAVAQCYCNVYPLLDLEKLRVSNGYLMESAGWNNKMFVRADYMPHQIRITGVNVERLWDISDAECLEEGVQMVKTQFGVRYVAGGGKVPSVEVPLSSKCSFGTPRAAFVALINSVSGRGTYERNPWVFVYKFELLK